jgi:CDP-diacylglycerol--glycerol-3-phosphate 3-phosphatidyltransferase
VVGRLLSTSTPSLYGPSALLTPANGVTVARVLVTPLLLVWIGDRGAAWSVELLWLILSFTDWIDGWFARRQGATRSGAFLDPLADKFLVLGAMAALVNADVFHLLPVLLIAAREVAMSVYRAVVARRGVSIPARRTAKVKTAVQDLAVGLAVLPGVGDDHPSIARAVLWVAVVLTLYTGWEYWREARHSESRAPSAV